VKYPSRNKAELKKTRQYLKCNGVVALWLANIEMKACTAASSEVSGPFEI
jgi:hypothetical protein